MEDYERKAQMATTALMYGPAVIDTMRQDIYNTVSALRGYIKNYTPPGPFGPKSEYTFRKKGSSVLVWKLIRSDDGNWEVRWDSIGGWDDNILAGIQNPKFFWAAEVVEIRQNLWILLAGVMEVFPNIEADWQPLTDAVVYRGIQPQA